LGPGALVQSRLGEHTYLRGLLIAQGLGFAAAGSLGLQPDIERDYHIGPGIGVLAELRLLQSGWGALGAQFRYWTLNGIYSMPASGYESITYFTTEVRLRIASHVGLGLQLPVSVRAYGFGNSSDHTVLSYGPRIALYFLTDDTFGVVLRAAKP
jgi:hypothetical protein